MIEHKPAIGFDSFFRSSWNINPLIDLILWHLDTVSIIMDLSMASSDLLMDEDSQTVKASFIKNSTFAVVSHSSSHHLLIIYSCSIFSSFIILNLPPSPFL